MSPCARVDTCSALPRPLLGQLIVTSRTPEILDNEKNITYKQTLEVSTPSNQLVKLAVAATIATIVLIAALYASLAYTRCRPADPSMRRYLIYKYRAKAKGVVISIVKGETKNVWGMCGEGFDFAGSILFFLLCVSLFLSHFALFVCSI
jgi:hypothetical protein